MAIYEIISPTQCETDSHQMGFQCTQFNWPWCTPWLEVVVKWDCHRHSDTDTVTAVCTCWGWLYTDRLPQTQWLWCWPIRRVMYIQRCTSKFCHNSVYIILFLTWHDELINENENKVFIHRLCVLLCLHSADMIINCIMLYGMSSCYRIMWIPR